MALAAGTLDTIACPDSVCDTKIPLPNGGSEAEPIFFGTKSITLVLRADFEKTDNSPAVSILLELR